MGEETHMETKALKMTTYTWNSSHSIFLRRQNQVVCHWVKQPKGKFYYYDSQNSYNGDKSYDPFI